MHIAATAEDEQDGQRGRVKLRGVGYHGTSESLGVGSLGDV